MSYSQYTPTTLQMPPVALGKQITSCFSIWIEYGHHSAMGGGAETLEQAKAMFRKDVAFYRDLGQIIREATLVQHCAKCGGKGRVELRKKRLSPYAQGELVICPICHGTDSATLIICTTDAPEGVECIPLCPTLTCCNALLPGQAICSDCA